MLPNTSWQSPPTDCYGVGFASVLKHREKINYFGSLAIEERARIAGSCGTNSPSFFLSDRLNRRSVFIEYWEKILVNSHGDIVSCRRCISDSMQKLKRASPNMVPAVIKMLGVPENRWIDVPTVVVRILGRMMESLRLRE